MIYKKAVYDPAKIIVDRIDSDRKGGLCLAQTGRLIEYDGVRIEEQDIDIEELYKSGYMKE